MSIADRALLVNLRIAIWTARAKDDKAARAAEKQAGAEAGVGRFNKLLVGKEAMNHIYATVRVARREIEDLTLPWGDDGTRLLPGERWTEFEERMRNQLDKFSEAVDEFMEAYERHRKTAKKRMGELYNPKDYPEPETIRRRFKFKMEYVPFPDAEDVRIKLDPDERSAIEASVREHVMDKMAGAMRDVFYRLHQAAETIHGQLDNESAIVRRQTHEHIQALLEVLPKLNVTRDPQLTKAAEMLQEQVLVFDRDTLQVNRARRRQAATAAKRVVTMLDKGIAKLDEQLEE